MRARVYVCVCVCCVQPYRFGGTGGVANRLLPRILGPGRAQEVPGEDPYLTGEYGSYIISATQQPGDDPRYLAAASTMKHFSMYDFEGIAPWGPDQYVTLSGGRYATPNTSSCDGWTQSPTDGHKYRQCSRMTMDA